MNAAIVILLTFKLCMIMFSDVDILDAGDVLLASCGQDCYIRLWRISSKTRETIADSSELDLKLSEVTFSVLAESMYVFEIIYCHYQYAICLKTNF